MWNEQREAKFQKMKKDRDEHRRKEELVKALDVIKGSIHFQTLKDLSIENDIDDYGNSRVTIKYVV